MGVILVFFFSAVIFAALKNEKKKMGAPSSPLVLVLGFNIGILALYFVTSKYLGFHSLVLNTLVILIYGCFLFSVVSLLFTNGTIIRNNHNKNNKLRYVRDYPSRTVVVFAMLTVVFMILKMLAMGMNDIIEDEDSAALFGSGGLSGHVLVLQVFLTTHFIGRKFTKLSIAAVVGMLFCLFIYNVKAWIIIPIILGWFIRRDLMGMKMNPLVMVLVPLGSLAVFVISYMMTLGWDVENMNFIWAHFCKYVYAGIGGLNEALIQHYPIGTCPFYGTPSFIRLFIPISLNTASEYHYSVINDLNGEYTNVYSLLGSAYLFNGLFFGTLYILLIAYISYVLYRKRLNTDNYWFYLAYYFWSAGLILSFFGNYYMLLNIWELTVDAFIVGVFFRERNKAKTEKLIQSVSC